MQNLKPSIKYCLKEETKTQDTKPLLLTSI